jgi:hypothetical protein
MAADPTRTRPRTRLTLAAAAWSAVYGVLGLLWASGVPGFPYGRSGDPSAAATLFPDATVWPGALVIAILGTCGALFGAAVAMADPRGRFLRSGVVAGAIVAVALIAILPDYRVLLAVAYLPLIVLGAPFGWPPDVEIGFVLPWPVLNQFVLIAGGALWAGLAVESRRRAVEDRSGEAGDAIGEWLVRVGGPATVVAVAVPLLYAATRYAWALGIPIGLSPALYEQGRQIGLWMVGAGLATVALVGALLTLGLIQDWGVRLPRWLPVIGGHTVPTNLAVLPALAAAFVVTSAGMMFVRLFVTGRLGRAFVFAEDLGWVAIVTELLWPIWGAALALAAISYRERRLRSAGSPRTPEGRSSVADPAARHKPRAAHIRRLAADDGDVAGPSM